VWETYRLDFKSVHKDLQNLISKDVYEKIALLGRRTAEMHLALASNPDVADFAPKNFTTDYQNYLCEHLTSNVTEKLKFLKSIRNALPTNITADIDKVLGLKDKILAIFQDIKKQPITAQRVRMHGDYHLGQVLFTGTDFVIIDFEGEPATPFPERRIKHTVLKDVAGMVRSFHYAVYATLLQNEKFKDLDTKQLALWAETWYLCARGFYLDSYFDTISTTELIPKDSKSTEILLKAFLMEKAIYELCYEANNRPTWLMIPLNGVMKLASM
jgi:maltose alpha-D-glucosyltransferase/alpha-amylase